MSEITLRFERGKPCPACGADTKGCSATEDGLHFCRGEPGSGWFSVKKGERDENGFGWFRRDDPSRAVRQADRPGRKKAAKVDWPARAKQFAENLHPDRRSSLSMKILGLPADALDVYPLLGTGKNDDEGRYYTFPEFDARGRVIGLSRRFNDGSKKCMSGSKRGLSLPHGWRDRPGPVFVVEGPTDAAALTAAGLAAVGRPSNSGGVGHLGDLFHELPPDRPVIVVGENDQKPDGLWPGRDGAESIARSLMAVMGRLVPWVLPPGGAKDVRAWLTAADRGESSWQARGAELAKALEAEAAKFRAGKPVVLISHDESEAIRRVTGVLSESEEKLFLRGAVLVRIDPGRVEDGALIPPAIVDVSLPELRERITDRVRLEELGREKEAKPCNPPHWLAPGVAAVAYRGNFRWLSGISTSPVLRDDGTVHQCPGYDPKTGVFYIAGADLAPIPECPTRDDARRELQRLIAGVRQFPWRSEADKSAWVSSVLTVAARRSFNGPSPLFVGVANHPGAGKSNLTHAAGIIGTGREALVENYPTLQPSRGRITEDHTEMRKLKTAVLDAGHPAFCLDNVPNGYGFHSHVLDSVVTNELDGGRLTGTGSARARVCRTVWFINGNGIYPLNDTVRRCLPFRLLVTDPRTLSRGFEGMEIKAWARKHRAELFASALTVVAAYIRAGRPDQGLSHFPSFEAWSDTIRSAVVWAGMPDPLLTRREYESNNEDEAEAGHLMDLLFDLEPGRGPLKAKEILGFLADDLKAGAKGPHRHPAAWYALRTVFPVGEINARQLGKAFSSHADRPVNGRCIAGKEDRDGAMAWTVRTSSSTGGVVNTPSSAGFDLTNPAGGDPNPAPNPAPQTFTEEGSYEGVRGLRGSSPSVDPSCERGEATCASPVCGAARGDSDPANPAGDPNRLEVEGVKVPGLVRGGEEGKPRTPRTPEEGDDEEVFGP